MARKLRVLVDTNVLFSGLFWRGAPHLILSLMEGGQIELLLPEQVIREAEEVMQEIKPEEKQLLDTFLKGFSKRIRRIRRPSERELVEVRKRVRDPDDAPILAAAFTSKPDFFVSGDKDLLTPKIRSQKDFVICSSTEFLEQYLALKGKELSEKAPDLYTKIMVYLAGLEQK